MFSESYDQATKRVLRRWLSNPSRPTRELAKWKRLLRMKYSWLLHLRYILVVTLIRGSSAFQKEMRNPWLFDKRDFEAKLYNKHKHGNN